MWRSANQQTGRIALDVLRQRAQIVRGHAQVLDHPANVMLVLTDHSVDAQDRLRAAPDNHFFDVISRGFGAMYPYGSRIRVEDRWAIVAYVRALQLGQNAKVSQLPPEARAKLEAVQ